MYNKNNDVLKIVGTVLGTLVGAAALATAGAVLLYKKKEKERKEIAAHIYQVAACDDCPVKDECVCQGKHALECGFGECVIYDSCECDECVRCAEEAQEEEE